MKKWFSSGSSEVTELKKWFSSGGNKVTEIVGVMVNLLEDRRKTLFTRG